MRRAPSLPLALALTLALAGCVSTASPDLGTAAAPLAQALAFGEPVVVTGALTTEPDIAQTPDGTLFVAGYSWSYVLRWGPPVVWRSVDDGATWELLDLGTPLEGAIGNADVDLAVAPDGALWLVNIVFMDQGSFVVAGVSTDQGGSWRWSMVTLDATGDRPWIGIDPEGVAHVVWNNAFGIHHATSRDGGASWQEQALVHGSGGTGRLAVGPQGELAVRVIPLGAPVSLWTPFQQTVYLGHDPEADGVAVSTDGGATWSFRELPGERGWVDATKSGGDGTPRWADPIDFDDAGTLYAAWPEGDLLHVVASRDLGATWEPWRSYGNDGKDARYPYVDAAGDGDVVVTWYARGEGDDPFEAHVAWGEERATLPYASDGGTGGEYFPATRLADGSLAAATSYYADTTGFEWWRAPPLG